MNTFNRIDDALIDLNSAISYHPTEYVAYKNRGCLLAMKEDFQSAIDDFKICLKILTQSGNDQMVTMQINEVKDLMKEALEELREGQTTDRKKQKSLQ